MLDEKQLITNRHVFGVLRSSFGRTMRYIVFEVQCGLRIANNLSIPPELDGTRDNCDEKIIDRFNYIAGARHAQHRQCAGGSRAWWRTRRTRARTRRWRLAWRSWRSWLWRPPCRDWRKFRKPVLESLVLPASLLPRLLPAGRAGRH